MTVLRTTTSLCPHCKRSLAADLVRVDGQVVMRRTCPEHGDQEALVSSNADWYDRVVAQAAQLTPPTPRVRFILVADEVDAVTIDELAVNSGVVRKDEMRAARGLEPLGPENGGDEFIRPLAKTPPSQPVTQSVTEDREDVPFPRDLKGDILDPSTSAAASRTSLASAMSPLERALSTTSVDPEL